MPHPSVQTKACIDLRKELVDVVPDEGDCFDLVYLKTPAGKFPRDMTV